MRLAVIGSYIVFVFFLALFDGYLIGRGWSKQARLRTALSAVIFFSIFLVIAGVTGMFTSTEGMR